MKKLLDREPTPEMLKANEGHGVALYQSYWDAATALPEPGEVEQKMRLFASALGEEDAKWCNAAADLIAALTQERDELAASIDANWICHQRIVDAEKRAEKAEEERNKTEAAWLLDRQALKKAEAILNDDGPEGHKVSNEQHVALRAENERLREDAERYRWLRTPGIEQVRIMADLDESIGWNDSLDAAIDAAKGKP